MAKLGAALAAAPPGPVMPSATPRWVYVAGAGSSMLQGGDVEGGQWVFIGKRVQKRARLFAESWADTPIPLAQASVS